MDRRTGAEDGMTPFSRMKSGLRSTVRREGGSV